MGRDADKNKIGKKVIIVEVGWWKHGSTLFSLFLRGTTENFL